MLKKESAIQVEGADRRGSWIIVCDQASNAIPDEFGNLGLSEEDRSDHISWDIGAWALSRQLGLAIDVPVIGGVVSRLVVDINRYPQDHDGSIPSRSDGVLVAANCALSDGEREQRLERWFYPYHRQLAEFIATFHNPAPKLMLIHSFTPQMRSADATRRPWHVGFICDKNRGLTDRAIRYLESSEWCVGDNEPYGPRNPDSYTLPEHCEIPGREYLVVEVRNDLLRDEAGVNRWCKILKNVVYHIDDTI